MTQAIFRFPPLKAHAFSVAACLLLSLGTSLPATAADTVQFPDVLAAKVRPLAADRFDFDVTISSPYDSPQRYADGFRVTGADGTVYGERKLFHDHASEQPFTRDLYGVVIPSTLRTVRIQARDQRYGYGGKTIEVTLPERHGN
ncbi:MAG: hypothetical protein RBT39_12690 [Azoarcus sp.]|jgi:hypothetical protein|nr:hypothetical protein [Azoarcus sp.]MDD2874383.1 hypothetical protein [Azoarcus sp.]MDX9838415.1 hypothetical protein [Azoarcus sp.]